MATQFRRTLNTHGVKSSCDMWRTFNGVAFGHWTTEQFDGQALAYKRAGIRARLRGGEIFVHPEDEAKAAQFDRRR